MKKKKVKTEKSLPGYFIPAWGAQAVSYSFAFTILGYITYYCTNVVGLSASVVGTMLLISKLLDGVTDIIAAIIIERTNSKWGKGRPYVLFMPLAWIFMVLMFSTPTFGAAGQLVYIFMCYFMVNSVCITLVNAAEPVHLARSLKNAADSSTVLSLGGLLSGIAGVIAAIVLPLMITGLGTQTHGWTYICLIFAIPCSLLSLVRFTAIKECKNIAENTTCNKERKKFGLTDAIRVLVANPHALILIIVQLLANVFSGLQSGVSAYYFQYIMGDLNKMSTVSAASGLAMFLIVFAPMLIKKTSVKTVMYIGMVCGIIGGLLKMIPSIPVLIVAHLFSGVAVIPTGMLLPSLLIDCMDYNEWKTGERVEGIFGSMNSFAMKLGSGIASVSIGLLLGIVGFEGKAATQTIAANDMINALFSWSTALIFFLMIVVFHFYRIDKEIPRVRKELEERRSTSAK